MIEVCSNKEVEKTLQSGVDRRLQPEAGNFLSYSVQERNITIMNEQNNSAFYLSFLGNLGFQVCFIPFLLSYESNSDVSLFFFFFFFFLPNNACFILYWKALCFMKLVVSVKKFKHGPFNWKFPIKRKTKRSWPALGYISFLVFAG